MADYKSLLKYLDLSCYQSNCLFVGLLNAKSTLKILDIEHSVLISDECVPLLVKFSHLSTLATAKTNLSSEGQAHIIYNLNNLVLLPRGDFLCDALGKSFSFFDF